MWRAANGDPSKRPSKWLETESAKVFREFIAENHGVRIRDTVRAQSGGAGGSGATWAHWQLAMAYAKYLSPEFHAWCNDVVRAHMAGQTYGGVDHSGLQLAIQRGFEKGAELMIAKIESVKGDIDILKVETRALSKSVTELSQSINVRKDFTARVRGEFIQVVREKYGCDCPVCRDTRIVTDGRILRDAAGSLGQFDHWNNVRSQNQRENGWLICRFCHARKDPSEFEPHFRSFQKYARNVAGTDLQLTLVK
jgi:hypothetical protein